jgi:hypothetical protein
MAWRDAIGNTRTMTAIPPETLYRAPSRVVVAKLDQAPGGTARLSYRRAEELFQGRDRVHAASASALRADAPGGGRRLAPMLITKSRHRSIVSLARYARPSIEALQRFEAERDPTRRR